MYDMKLPARHVEKVLGRSPRVILGDVEEGTLVLYASERLPGYVPAGSGFRKRIGLRDSLVEAKRADILDGHACVYPMRKTAMRPPDFEKEVTAQNGPEEELRQLLGVSGSFGYIPSGALVEHFYPGTDVPLIYMPPGISLAHEGAHVASVKEIDLLFGDYENLLSDDVLSDEVQRASFHEAVAFWVEREYTRLHEPDWLDRYDAARSDDNEIHAEYGEANRLVREEREGIEELVSRVREINLKKR